MEDKLDKIEILARLLKKDYITIDEFKILFEKEIQYLYNYYPVYYRNNSPFIGGTLTYGTTLSNDTINSYNAINNKLSETLGEENYNKIFNTK